MKTYRNTDANGDLMAGYRYTYDVNGNIIKIEEAYTASAYRDLAVYTYDALNQLDSETRYTYSGASATPATTTVVDYSIDTAGNLRSVSGGAHSISYTYGNSSWADLLTGITVDGASRTISYSSAGNPGNWFNGTDYTGLTWTQGRRLSSVTKQLTSGGRTYNYYYDMSGVRSSKTIEITVDGVLRHRRYDYVTQNGKVVRETAYYTDGDGEFMYCLDFFYDENGNPFAMRKYSDENLTSYNSYYYILNAQGDVVKLIAPSGNVYAEYTYDAWGNILDSSGSLRNINPLRYRGYYYDKETGFYYLQSRYYDPALGRFINADSYASTGQSFLGYNMFAYCNNNLMNKKDDLGNRPLNVNVMMTDGGCGYGTHYSSSVYRSDTKESGKGSYQGYQYEYAAKVVKQAPKNEKVVQAASYFYEPIEKSNSIKIEQDSFIINDYKLQYKNDVLSFYLHYDCGATFQVLILITQREPSPNYGPPVKPINQGIEGIIGGIQPTFGGGLMFSENR